ncbi:hypothetical protein [Pseudofulvibacter geojedonensis]|uniref:Uncharacterized protein n=1 Tax=Pseudofulvibacter geojedonensis TaxID=1123758 RepID=A0ABW3I213_9FLAO
MPKLYAEGSTQMNKLQPKKETVDFILNYSKALKVIKLKKMKIELLQN